MDASNECDIEFIKQNIGFISFTLKDGTKVTVQSTLSPFILESYGIEHVEGKIWDFRFNCYADLRTDVEEVSFYKEFPEYDEEVLRFGSRFI